MCLQKGDDYKMSLYKMQREKVKNSIIDMTTSLFKENGYDKVSVEDITKAVGIAKGTFYNFFSSKRDILMIWSEHKFLNLDIEEATRKDRCIEDNLRNLIKILINTISEDYTLFASFLRELMFVYNENSLQGRFDLKPVLLSVISNSKDYSEIGKEYMEAKIKLMRSVLFLEMLNWFNAGNELDGLEDILADNIKVALHGVLRNLD